MDCAAVDYLAIRVKRFSTVKELIEKFLHLEMEAFTPCKPGYKYRDAVASGNIRVYYNGLPGMGMCVQMTGEGCRQYCARHRNGYAIIELFRRLRPEDRVTRIDYAFDDFSGTLDLNLMLEKHRGKEVRTRLKIMDSYINRDGKVESICYGSSQSKQQIKIYDKAAETDYDSDWTRVELVARKQGADQLVKYFLQSVDAGLPLKEQDEALRKIAAGVLKKKLEYVDRTSSNISRCPICAWWTEFLEDCEGMTLPMAARTTGLSQTEMWLKSTVEQSLAAMAMARGADWLLGFLSCGVEKNRRPNSKYHLLRREMEAFGLEPAIPLDDAAEDKLFELLEVELRVKKDNKAA